MKYLIDTHVLLWSLFDKRHLCPTAIKILTDSNNVIYVSTISLWEISLKYSLGKLIIPNKGLQLLPKAIEETGFILTDPKPTTLISFYQLPRLHKDPFDRLLVWQAIRNKWTFISKDNKMKLYKPHGLIWITA